MPRNRNTKKAPKGPKLGNMSYRTGRNANSNNTGFPILSLKQILAMTGNPASSSAFSMQDEARNTARSREFWDQDNKLRTRPITFVSAGLAKPVDIVQNKDKHQPEVSPVDHLPGNRDEEGDRPHATRPEPKLGLEPVPGPDLESGPDTMPVEQQEGVLITTLDEDDESEREQQEIEPMAAEPPQQPQNLESKMNGLVQRDAESNGDSDNSWEDNLVRGLGALYPPERLQNHQEVDKTQESTNPAPSPMAVDSAKSEIERQGSGESPEEEVTPTRRRPFLKPLPDDSTPQASSENLIALSNETSSSAEVILFQGRNRGRRGCSGRGRTRGGRGRGRDQGLRGRKDRGNSLREQQQREKEEEAGIMADYVANMAHDSSELGGSEVAEPQSLAPWKYAPVFAKRDMGHDIPADPEAQSSCPQSSDEADEYDRGEDDNDENATEMDDETLARLLSLQDELDLGMDDLVLYDSNRNLGLPESPSQGRTKGRWSGPRKFSTKGGNYPSASKLADALEEFALDSGPSLVPQKRKGRKGQPPPFKVDDSDMEAALSMAWQNDRLAKKEKRQHREELRSQGLLDHKSSGDMRIKYPTGIRIDEIKEELRLFVMGSDESLAFCPLDTHGRRIVHMFANKLKLKSKSGGAGDNRHPVVYRTKATPKYDAGLFEARIVTRGRPFFARPDVKGASRTRAQGTDGDGGGTSALWYRDGDVVSGGVPEIGEGNKGRAMLEKMGWSRGTALGSINNKGILEPVAQIVKTSKAGLGAASYD